MMKLNTTQKISLSTIKELKEALKNLKDDTPINDFTVNIKTKLCDKDTISSVYTFNFSVIENKKIKK